MNEELALKSLPQIKGMLRLRWLSLFMAILFTALAVEFTFGKWVPLWPWVDSFLLAGGSVTLALINCTWYLLLRKKLAVSGL
jgi:hypothetical protein